MLLPELDGYFFDSKDSTAKSFSQAQKLDFRRSRLDLQIILKESTPSSKYELFERLNTGGSIASPQEVRNCVLVWINESLFDWMLTLCSDTNFTDTTPISERLEDEQFRMELLLRFLVLHSIIVEELRGIKDLSEFLNIKNRALAEEAKPRREDLESKFRSTFRLLNDALAGDVFRKYDSNRDRFLGAFLISAFEAVSMGVAFNIHLWEKGSQTSEKLAQRVRSLWSMPEYVQNIGIGVSSSTRMVKTIPLGRELFKP